MQFWMFGIVVSKVYVYWCILNSFTCSSLQIYIFSNHYFCCWGSVKHSNKICICILEQKVFLDDSPKSTKEMPVIPFGSFNRIASMSIPRTNLQQISVPSINPMQPSSGPFSLCWFLGSDFEFSTRERIFVGY